jgi:hypothetical protein
MSLLMAPAAHAAEYGDEEDKEEEASDVIEVKDKERMRCCGLI